MEKRKGITQARPQPTGHPPKQRYISPFSDGDIVAFPSPLNKFNIRSRRIIRQNVGDATGRAIDYEGEYRTAFSMVHMIDKHGRVSQVQERILKSWVRKGQQQGAVADAEDTAILMAIDISGDNPQHTDKSKRLLDKTNAHNSQLEALDTDNAMSRTNEEANQPPTDINEDAVVEEYVRLEAEREKMGATAESTTVNPTMDTTNDATTIDTAEATTIEAPPTEEHGEPLDNADYQNGIPAVLTRKTSGDQLVNPEPVTILRTVQDQPDQVLILTGTNKTRQVPKEWLARIDEAPLQQISPGYRAKIQKATSQFLRDKIRNTRIYQVLHNQLGGIGYDEVNRFVKEGRGPSNFTMPPRDTIPLCAACPEAKQAKQPTSTVRSRETRTNDDEVINTDPEEDTTIAATRILDPLNLTAIDKAQTLASPRAHPLPPAEGITTGTPTDISSPPQPSPTTEEVTTGPSTDTHQVGFDIIDFNSLQPTEHALDTRKAGATLALFVYNQHVDFIDLGAGIKTNDAIYKAILEYRTKMRKRGATRLDIRTDLQRGFNTNLKSKLAQLPEEGITMSFSTPDAKYRNAPVEQIHKQLCKRARHNYFTAQQNILWTQDKDTHFVTGLPCFVDAYLFAIQQWNNVSHGDHTETPAERINAPTLNLATIPPFLAKIFPPTAHHETSMTAHRSRAYCGHFLRANLDDCGADVSLTYYPKQGGRESRSINADKGQVDYYYDTTSRNINISRTAASYDHRDIGPHKAIGAIDWHYDTTIRNINAKYTTAAFDRHSIGAIKTLLPTLLQDEQLDDYMEVFNDAQHTMETDMAKHAHTRCQVYDDPSDPLEETRSPIPLMLLHKIAAITTIQQATAKVATHLQVRDAKRSETPTQKRNADDTAPAAHTATQRCAAVSPVNIETNVEHTYDDDMPHPQDFHTDCNNNDMISPRCAGVQASTDYYDGTEQALRRHPQPDPVEALLLNATNNGIVYGGSMSFTEMENDASPAGLEHYDSLENHLDRLERLPRSMTEPLMQSPTQTPQTSPPDASVSDKFLWEINHQRNNATVAALRHIPKPTLGTDATSTQAHTVPVPTNHRQAMTMAFAPHIRAGELHELEKMEQGFIDGGPAWEWITEKEAHSLAKKHHLEILHSMWAYKIKSDKNGFIKEFRCRITQCGNGDVTMTSRDDGFSPVIRQMTTRALISETQATHNLECFDAPLAYLNGMARRLIIMHAPPGHAKFDTEGRPMKVILRRNLYGGVDSGKIWGEMLDEELRGCGLIKSVNDPCLYFNDDRSVILTTYVDDILMAWNDITKKDRVVRLLEEKFAIKHEGPLDDYLGCQYNITTEGTTINNSKLIRALRYDHFGKNKPLLPTYTPINPAQDTTPAPKRLTEEEMRRLEERMGVDIKHLVGCLLFIAGATRPDIALAVSRLARWVTRPTESIIHAALHIVKYLDATNERGILIKPANGAPTTCWVDASYLGEKQQHGHPRYGFILNVNDSPIAWKTSYVGHTCLSTCEAEYCALSLATKQAVHLQQIQADLRGLTDQYQTMLSGEMEGTINPRVPVDYDPAALKSPPPPPPNNDTITKLRRLKATLQVIIREDNQPAIDATTSNHSSYLRMRHISAQYHYVRELHQKGVIKVIHSPGTQMIADFLTKFSISGEKFRTMAESITHDPTADNNAIKPHPKHVLPTENTEQRHRDDGTGSTSNISKVHTLRAPCQKDTNKKKVTQL